MTGENDKNVKPDAHAILPDTKWAATEEGSGYRTCRSTLDYHKGSGNTTRNPKGAGAGQVTIKLLDFSFS